MPEYQDTPELAIDSLPVFDSEQLHGKRIIYLGMGGGSDGIQAAMLSKLHQQHYAVQPTAIVSVRNFAADSNKQLAHTGRQIGDALAEITKETTKVGDWRFLEDIIAKDETIAPVYLLNSIEPEQISHDLQILIRETGADAICGIDTGGDVLYRANTAIDPTTSSPDQDYAVLAALHMINVAAGQMAHHSMSLLLSLHLAWIHLHMLMRYLFAAAPSAILFTQTIPPRLLEPTLHGA